MMDSRPSARTTFWASLALWFFWLVSALPLLVLFLEFRCGEIGECGAEWWYYARFYSHFFLYPVTFGFISTALLRHPLIWTVHHLLSLPEPTRTKVIGVVVGSVVVVVGVFSYGELYSEHSSSAFKNCENATEFTGSTPAPWSIAPDVMEAEDEDMLVRSLLEKRCLSDSQSLNDSEKCEFQEKLSVLWKDRNRSASYTELFYRVGFVAMTTLFALLFATILIVLASKIMKNSAWERNSEVKHMKTLLVLALLSATFWALMRGAFIYEKLSVYPGDPLLASNWLILLGFVVVHAWTVIAWWPNHERYERYLAPFFTIAGFAIGVIALFGGGVDREWIPEFLVGTFGTGGSPLTYLAVLSFLLLVHFPYILRYVHREDGKSDDARGPGAT